MALWVKARQLQGDSLSQVKAVYGDHFPIEVRHVLADWIEQKSWNDIDPDNQAHEHLAASLVTSLIQELEAKAQQLNGAEYFVMKIKLTDAAVKFRQLYTHNPFSLVRIITHCLNTEMNIIQLAENPPVQGDVANAGVPLDSHNEIVQTLETLRKRTQETEEDVRKMHLDQESFFIQYRNNRVLEAHIMRVTSQKNGQHAETIPAKMKRKEQADQQLSERAVNLHDLTMKLEKKHEDTIRLLNLIQSRVLDEELMHWKRKQQLAGNGAPFDNNLDTIQEWCEALAELIWENRQQIKRVETLRAQLYIGKTSDTNTTLNQITSLLSSLVTSTFIVEKQPPQVMKTLTKFTATVRHLVGDKLRFDMTPPQVKVTIISEAQANLLLTSEMNKGESSGEILNNTGTMEYNQSTRQLSVSFRNTQLRKIKRARKKGTESVMDEKFSLLFQSQFKAGEGDVVFEVWTLSLPIVVIVNVIQEPQAWATVTWDNAFAEAGRVPFAVPEKVPWLVVATVLNCKFKAETGRGLSKENVWVLAGKAFRNDHVADYSNMLLSWSQFCKDPLPGRSFTFWDWFYAIMKLTEEHMRGPWNDGAIMGFVTRHQAEGKLKEKCSGTFLLRFSDSKLGGVTIAWIENDLSTDMMNVQMLQPFTNKDFVIRSLADRIDDLKQFVYLYPDTPKDEIYQKYYSSKITQHREDGYVTLEIVIRIPDNPSTQHQHQPALSLNCHSRDDSTYDSTALTNSPNMAQPVYVEDDLYNFYHNNLLLPHDIIEQYSLDNTSTTLPQHIPDFDED